MPSASGIADSTPRPDAVASASPGNSSTERPNSFAIASSSGPFEASRTAAVATVRVSSTSIALASIAKRASEALAIAIPSALIAPVSASPRPRPAITFSLNSVAGSRAGPS